MSKPINEPTQQITHWLTAFSSALDQSDFRAAAGMFAAESYWRDLVAFTWNIKTAEGQANIKAMLTETVAQTEPSGWQIEGEATTNGDVTEAWFTFETGVARGKGHLRLQAGLCRTLLTTIQELKGFEEKKGANEYRALSMVPSRIGKTGLSYANEKRPSWAITNNPVCGFTAAISCNRASIRNI